VWQKFLGNKYLHAKTPSQVSIKPTNLSFGKGLMRAKEELFVEEISMLDENDYNT
jgi:hypothetical protein